MDKKKLSERDTITKKENRQTKQYSEKLLEAVV